EVRPGWHMNKHHWNTVHFEGSLDDALLLRLVDHSYELIVASLPKKLQRQLEELGNG
ncbi:MAG: MmcQ/YjbR family DNA-binding protein, partial [Phaeodactylibacter sp.]|nr:MmcQ/YjbR family DNA-binding protein [Phaeodactylibacter sp.]